MKGWGQLALIAGVVGLIAALSMDTSVSTGYGRVNNLGLMKDQQNYIFIAIALMVIGLMMVIGARKSANGDSGEARGGPTRKCPECEESILIDAKVCRYCGNRDLPEIEVAPKPTVEPTLMQKLWWNPHAQDREKK